MKKIILLMLLAAGTCRQTVFAQIVNEGAKIHIAEGGVLFVDGTFKHQLGSILNDGRLVVKGDWQNNDPNSAAFVKPSAGVVELAGIDQQIAGTFLTEFPSLHLTGSGLKSLSINTDIAGTLSLNDSELKTGAFLLTVLNPSPDAVERTTGFVNTENNGQLVRMINSANTYLYPLGNSEGGTLLYRPVEVEQQDAVQNFFGISFIKKDPTSEGYSRLSKLTSVETVYDKYFYILDQNGASKLNIRFYQNTADDGNFQKLVNWNTSGFWEKASPSTVATGTFGDGLDQNLLYTSVGVIFKMPFTLAAVNDESPFTFFNAFSPDGDGKNDTWEVKNLDLYPNNDLSVFNRWGDAVFKVKSYSSSKAWDGGNLNPGTYYYILNVDEDGVQKTYKGFITMVKKD